MNDTSPTSEQTVPNELLGCWRRDWIRWADGTFDDRSEVIWLQTKSAMADLRLDGDRLHLGVRSGLSSCSFVELLDLARSESSSGITRCSAPGDSLDGQSTATWHGSADGVDFQPISSYPEPGLLTWNVAGTVMIERAPSGAYVEQWSLIPNSRDFLFHMAFDPDSEGRRSSLYVACEVAMYVRDRAVGLDRRAPLVELIRQCGSDRQRAEQLVDCEFSFAVCRDEHYVITLSTLPWRQGQTLDLLPGAKTGPERP